MMHLIANININIEGVDLLLSLIVHSSLQPLPFGDIGSRYKIILPQPEDAFHLWRENFNVVNEFHSRKNKQNQIGILGCCEIK